MANTPSRDLAAFFRGVREHSAEVRAGLDPEARAAHDETEARWESTLSGEVPVPKVPPFFAMSGTTLHLDPTWKAAARDDSDQVIPPERWARLIERHNTPPPCGTLPSGGVRIAMEKPDGGDGDA